MAMSDQLSYDGVYVLFIAAVTLTALVAIAAAVVDLINDRRNR